jgi:hypothetical protein
MQLTLLKPLGKKSRATKCSNWKSQGGMKPTILWGYVSLSLLLTLIDVYAQAPTAIFLKGGAVIQGEILEVSPEALNIKTARGELVIPLKNLEDVSRSSIEKLLISEKKDETVETAKDKSKLVSKILEEKEIQEQASEGNAPRLRFGRKDFIYRKYTHRGSEIDYIFTPSGQPQVYDSEETIRITFHESVRSLPEAKSAIQELIRNLDGEIQIIPSLPSQNSRGGVGGIEFAGTVRGENGDPSRVVFGRTSSVGKDFITVLYTRFGREKTFDETQAWLGRNLERLQLILRGLNNLPEEEALAPKTEVKREEESEGEKKEDQETPPE